MSSPQPLNFSRYQAFVVAILAFLQFTVVLDFAIMAPLGALLMPHLQITPSQFGLAVSVYAFSAGASGLMAAGFADRFDRKHLLLFFYIGFIVGTLLCGVATSYPFLLFARLVTGLFGGVISSIVMAITTDLFAMEVRGRVMGYVQSAFAASNVLGIPAGLFFSNFWGWHAPFLMIVAISTLVCVAIVIYLRPIDAHLAIRSDRNALSHLLRMVSRFKYLRAYAAMALLTTGGFMLMPFSSAFNVNNLGISLEALPAVYLVTGIFSLVAAPYMGRLSDTLGKFPLFCVGSLLSIAIISVYTRLGTTPLAYIIILSVFMFLGISSRMISAMALISAVPEPSNRGAFMAVNSSIQQISGGIASAISGLIVVQSAGGALQHFDTLGNVVILAMLATVAIMYWINRSVGS